MDITGLSLVRRLEAMRERHRLNPPDPVEDQSLPAEVDVVRIICSDAIVQV
jgi:hypothetical protein